MKVTINNHVLTIGWNYESRELNKVVVKKGLKKEDFKGKNKKQICEMLGLKAYPLPNVTSCIITDTTTGDIYTGTVKRHPNDPWSRELARRNSLDKAVWQLFPEGKKNGHNEEQSSNRAKFWNAYHNRLVRNTENNIKKCINKGLFTLPELREYVNQNYSVSFAMH